MGIGISDYAAALWKAAEPASYEELFIESEDGYSFFIELPDWAYIQDQGPFYIADNGAIYSISMTPSQTGELIGNLKD